MKRFLAATVALMLMPMAPLLAGDADAILGGALGGALGAAIGNEVGGRNGAILGSGVGAAVGTAITTDNKRHETRYGVTESHGHHEAEYDPPRYRTRHNIPAGHLPPPGKCRIWHPGRPAGHQPAPGNCRALRHRVPAGAWLVEG